MAGFGLLVREVLTQDLVIDHAFLPDLGGPTSEAIRSVELPGAKVSLLFRHGDVDVVLSEVDACGSIPDTLVAGGFSWHLVLEGRALFEQGDLGWEVLPSHSLKLAGTPSYRVVNPAEDHLRLLSVVVGPSTAGEPGGDR